MAAGQPQLIVSLQRADAYPHSVSDVDVRETHISWVFLTGEFAYKVKKPVQTPFLDFHTLDLRRHFCEEEIRLNQRFARDLYLGVVPITGSPETPHVDGAGEPIEYAVRMRQFPQEALLSQMAAAGSLTAAHIDQLAEVVADFHAQAASAPRASSWGEPEEVIREALDNFPPLATDLDDQAHVAARDLERWTRSAAERLAATFATRRAEGFVRECHGDLHLGNLVLLNQGGQFPSATAPRVTLFDGIEFNPSFRWIDVVSDVAFAVMDLADRGRVDFSRRLQNAYLERTGDYAGLAVWQWYLIYRALVRAKVASLRAGQTPPATEVHQHALRDAADYLQLAQSFAHRPRPKLWITCGVSGSGKTTGTQQLVEQLGAVRIRSDVERKRLAGLAATADSGSKIGRGLYTLDQSRRTYDRLREAARCAVQAGYAVIADATFLHRQERDRFRQLAAELHVEFGIIPFEADVAVLEQRVAARRGDASEATVEVLHHQLANREPLSEDEVALCSRPQDLISSHDAN